MGAVARVIPGIRVVVRRVDTDAIVDHAVAVVIDPVGDAVARAAIHVAGQVLVVVVDARVDHGHHDVAAPGGDVPRLHRVDVRVGHAATLARVVEAPEAAEARIVGRRLMLDDPVGLRVEDRGMATIVPERVLDPHSTREAHSMQVLDDREALVNSGADRRVRERLLGRRRRRLEAHQDRIGAVPGRRLGRDAERWEEQREQEQQSQQRDGGEAGRRADVHRAALSETNVTAPSSRD